MKTGRVVAGDPGVDAALACCARRQWPGSGQGMSGGWGILVMMNGILLASGMDALVIDASKRYQYNTAILDLYNKRNGDTAIQFLLDCYRNQG